MESYGCDVYAFDPSINGKDRQHSSHIQFFKLALGARNTKLDAATGWRTATLDGIRRYLQHQQRTIDYLKVDIEGGEWDVLRQLLGDASTLANVKQIGMEVHLLDADKYEEHRKLVAALEASGFTRFFSRPNPWMKRIVKSMLDIDDTSAGYEMAWFNTNFSSN